MTLVVLIGLSWLYGRGEFPPPASSVRPRQHDRFVLIGLCWLYGCSESPSQEVALICRSTAAMARLGHESAMSQTCLSSKPLHEDWQDLQACLRLP